MANQRDAVVRPITLIGEPVLRRILKNATAKERSSALVRDLIPDMIRTMHAADGVGLAANQVGVNLKVIVLECRVNRRYPDAPGVPLQVYINPRIVKRSSRTAWDWEGCLSIPGYRGRVPRAATIEFEALTPDGQRVRRQASGFEARILQHEIDHINGMFYVDRLPSHKEWLHVAWPGRWNPLAVRPAPRARRPK